MNKEDESKGKRFTLQAEEELRVEVDYESKIILKLLSGTAEVFGTEIVRGVDYKISGVKFAVFTWHGCELELQGTYQHAYLAEETPMVPYLNTHLALEKMRTTAIKDGTKGPRVVVVGPQDVGKSTVCKILLNYAVRSGRQPVFADVDVGQGQITLPGAIGAVGMERVLDIEEDIGDSAVLSYYYGHLSPGDNPKLYKKLVSTLAKSIDAKLSQDDRVRASGVIVNTCGWVDGLGYEILVDIVKAFDANVVLVIGHERVYADLLSEFESNLSVNILKLPKSGGVVVRDTRFRRKSRSQRIKEYFYGKGDLFPYSRIVHFNEVEVHQLGQASIAPDSALPIGTERTLDETLPNKVLPSHDLDHAILGVTYPAQSTENLGETNLLGFVWVQKVELESSTMTVLSPAPGKLPSKFLLLGTLKHDD